jgi:hypothetical protein
MGKNIPKSERQAKCGFVGKQPATNRYIGLEEVQLSETPNKGQRIGFEHPIPVENHDIGTIMPNPEGVEQ